MQDDAFELIIDDIDESMIGEDYFDAASMNKIDPDSH